MLAPGAAAARTQNVPLAPPRPVAIMAWPQLQLGQPLLAGNWGTVGIKMEQQGEEQEAGTGEEQEDPEAGQEGEAEEGEEEGAGGGEEELCAAASDDDGALSAECPNW